MNPSGGGPSVREGPGGDWSSARAQPVGSSADRCMPTRGIDGHCRKEAVGTVGQGLVCGINGWLELWDRVKGHG